MAAADPARTPLLSQRESNYNTLPQQSLQRWQHITSHPRWLLVSRYIALVLLGALVWGITFTMVGTAAGPEGQLFKIGVLGVTAYLCGCATTAIGLPSLLGMLLVGVLLRNVGFVKLTGHYLDVAADLRKVALVIILIRAGLGVDPVALKRLSGMVIRLSIIPSVVEASTIAVTSYFLLELPWIWGFLLGSVMAAVSPAVVVPCLFNLQDRGYGRNKGIATLVIAAASFDDIISVSAFGVMITIIYSTGSLSMKILRGPIGLFAGLLFGTTWGLLLWFLPERNDRFVVILRTILLGGGGVLALFGSEAIGYDGAGPLSCIVAAFVACHGWRKQGYTDDQNPVADTFAVFWTIFQPILFGLIGTEINLYFLDMQIVKFGSACLAVSLLMFALLGGTYVKRGCTIYLDSPKVSPFRYPAILASLFFYVLPNLVFPFGPWSSSWTCLLLGITKQTLIMMFQSRVVVSVLVAAGGNLNWKEKIFVAWAWFPKATVQAAIGPVALDIAREIESAEDELYATKVLIMAVLAILITAPVGATLINILGPRLLQRESLMSLESHVMPDLRQSSNKPQDVT